VKEYYYYTIGEFKCTLRCGETITIPEGYLTDGSSGGPDMGWSWLFHDWLYSAHLFDSGKRCSRKKADFVLLEILRSERMYLYRSCVRFVLTLEPLHGQFEKSWFDGGFRGPEYFPKEDWESSSTIDIIELDQ
jgi:hypothetical protein